TCPTLHLSKLINTRESPCINLNSSDICFHLSKFRGVLKKQRAQVFDNEMAKQLDLEIEPKM
ncbi:unnamed protein product, partial [Tenebrio molitor]